MQLVYRLSFLLVGITQQRRNWRGFKHTKNNKYTKDNNNSCFFKITVFFEGVMQSIYSHLHSTDIYDKIRWSSWQEDCLNFPKTLNYKLAVINSRHFAFVWIYKFRRWVLISYYCSLLKIKIASQSWLGSEAPHLKEWNKWLKAHPDCIKRVQHINKCCKIVGL